MDRKTMHLVLNLHKNTQPCNIGPEILVLSLFDICLVLYLKINHQLFTVGSHQSEHRPDWPLWRGRPSGGCTEDRGSPGCTGTVFSAGRWADDYSISRLPDIRSCRPPSPDDCRQSGSTQEFPHWLRGYRGRFLHPVAKS